MDERLTARGRWTIAVLLGPVSLYFLAFYAVPVSRLLVLSIWDGGFTLRPLLEAAAEPRNLRVFSTTLQIAVGATALTVVLAYPVAAMLARLSGRLLALAMMFVIFPLLTSVLVRTFAWIVLLGREGVVNQFLIGHGLIAAPLPLLFNRIGVFVGLVHVLLPMAVLPMYAAIRSIDPRLLRAAESLGAHPVVVFRTVFLPLSLPGVLAGGLLAFIAAAGAFITPVILGGPRDVMLAGLIGQLVEEALEWREAAALSVLMLMASLLLLVLQFRIGQRRGARQGSA